MSLTLYNEGEGNVEILFAYEPAFRLEFIERERDTHWKV